MHLRQEPAAAQALQHLHQQKIIKLNKQQWFSFKRSTLLNVDLELKFMYFNNHKKLNLKVKTHIPNS